MISLDINCCHIELVQYINDKLDKTEYVASMFFRLSRAFDTLHSGFVFEKIAKLGIRGNLNSWNGSFLKSHKFIVKIGQAKSTEYPVEMGIPRGSILGPLIFLLYVNDLPDRIREGRSLLSRTTQPL